MRVFASILLLCGVGCATQPQAEVRTLNAPVRIVVLSKSELPPHMPEGYCLPELRTVVVPFNGQFPDFYRLGHELWHLPELGGHYHP